MHELEIFFFFFKTCEKSGGMRACQLSGRSRCECVGTRVSEHAGVARTFSFVYTLPVYVRV